MEGNVGHIDAREATDQRDRALPERQRVAGMNASVGKLAQRPKGIERGKLGELARAPRGRARRRATDPLRPIPAQRAAPPPQATAPAAARSARRGRANPKRPGRSATASVTTTTRTTV